MLVGPWAQVRGCQGGGPGRWTAWMALRRVMWWWWWFLSLIGHVDGVERTMGDPGVGSASALAASRSRCGGLTRGQRAAEFSGVVRGFFRAKAQRQRRRFLRVL
jgi:hypothetical protein